MSRDFLIFTSQSYDNGDGDFLREQRRFWANRQGDKQARKLSARMVRVLTLCIEYVDGKRAGAAREWPYELRGEISAAFALCIWRIPYADFWSH